MIRWCRSADAGDQGHLQRCLLLSDGGHPAAAGSVCPVGRLRPPHHRLGDEGGIRPLLHAGRPKQQAAAIMSSAPVSTSPPTWAAPRWSRSRYSATIAVCNLPNRAVTRSAGDLRLRLVCVAIHEALPPLGGGPVVFYRELWRVIGSLLFFCACRYAAGAARLMPHRAASPIHRPVSPVSPVGTAGGGGLCGSGQLATDSVRST